MRYWSVFLLYLCFVTYMSYITYAQGCGTEKDKPIMTGAACSIKDLPKTDKEGVLRIKLKNLMRDKKKEPLKNTTIKKD